MRWGLVVVGIVVAMLMAGPAARSQSAAPSCEEKLSTLTVYVGELRAARDNAELVAASLRAALQRATLTGEKEPKP